MLPDWTILLIVLRENIFNKCLFFVRFYGKYKLFNICIALPVFVIAVHFKSIWVFDFQLLVIFWTSKYLASSTTDEG
jgi:hypothetical protein